MPSSSPRTGIIGVPAAGAERGGESSGRLFGVPQAEARIGFQVISVTVLVVPHAAVLRQFVPPQSRMVSDELLLRGVRVADRLDPVRPGQ